MPERANSAADLHAVQAALGISSQSHKDPDPGPDPQETITGSCPLPDSKIEAFCVYCSSGDSMRSALYKAGLVKSHWGANQVRARASQLRKRLDVQARIAVLRAASGNVPTRPAPSVRAAVETMSDRDKALTDLLEAMDRPGAARYLWRLAHNSRVPETLRRDYLVRALQIRGLLDAPMGETAPLDPARAAAWLARLAAEGRSAWADLEGRAGLTDLVGWIVDALGVDLRKLAAAVRDLRKRAGEFGGSSDSVSGVSVVDTPDNAGVCSVGVTTTSPSAPVGRPPAADPAPGTPCAEIGIAETPPSPGPQNGSMTQTGSRMA